MSATFFNLRRRLAAEQASRASDEEAVAEKPDETASDEEAVAEKPKKEKVKKDGK